MYDSNIEGHRLILYYLSLLFISDLITSIIRKFGANNTESAICDAIYSISFSTLKSKPFSSQIFDQLSLIVYLINETSSQSVKSLLEGLIQNESYYLYFFFSKFIRITTSMPVKVFYTYFRFKTPTKEVEEAATRMFLTAPDDDKKFPDIYNKLKDSNEMSKIGICAILIQRMNCTREDLENFINTKIIPQISNDTTIKNCLLAFWHCVSDVNIDPCLTFTEQTFTHLHNSLEIIKHRSNILTSEFLIDTFLNHFFEKANITFCSKIFLMVLIHIASLDFSMFLTKVLKKFLQLELTDHRFICLLQAVKYFNRVAFSEFATNDQLIQFNQQISEKIKDPFNSYQTPFEGKSSILLFESNLRGSRTLFAQSTQKVSMFLDFCEVENPTQEQFKMTTSVYTGKSLLSSMLSCIKYVFDETDFINEKFMERIISYTYNYSSCISKRAHKLIRTIYKDNSKFVDCLINQIPKLKDENQVYSVIRILFQFINAGYSFTDDQLKLLEYIALLCLTWDMPEIRDYGINILQITNLDISQLFLQNKSFLVRKVRNSIQQLGNCPLIPSDKIIQFTSIFNCNYKLSTWYLYEFLIMLIEKNRIDVIMKLKEMIGENFGANLGYIMYFINSFYSDENNEKVFEFLHQLIKNGKEALVIDSIQFIHPSLAVPCLQILCSIDDKNTEIATKSLLMFLHNSKMTDSIIQTIFPLIIQFLSIINTVFNRIGLNSPRVIKWDEAHEDLVVSHLSLILNYLSIIERSHQNSEGQISNDIWPSSSRNLIFRFLINWAMTKNSRLKKLREQSIFVMSIVSKCGTVFSDTVMLDSSIIHLFGQIATQYRSFLTSLLFYHVDLLLELFISAYYNQPRPIADLFLDAIISAIERQENKYTFVYESSGSLFLLTFVLKLKNHPRADDLLYLFLKLCLSQHQKMISFEAISEKLENSNYTEIIPEYFGYTAEAVFYEGFKLLKDNKHGHVASSEICDAMIPWISAIRLLPKQQTCTITTVNAFHHFTPYTFLVKMIETTEKIEDDSFSNFLNLWTELMKSPDHGELTILFLINWRKPHIKKRMFSFWNTNESIVKRLCLNFSFAYYYYITECQKRDFTNELWVVPIVYSAFRNNWAKLESHLIEIIHFIVLFNDNQTFEFYRFVCSQYHIYEIDTLVNVKSLIEHADAESWGNEALKWVVGCSSLPLASKSLKIFNLILKPINVDVAKLVCNSVLYHMNNDNDINLMTEYISDTFTVFNACFQGNEQFALQYLMSFVDSPFYQLSATQLLVNILTSRITSGQSWPAIIPIIDPLLLKLEDNERTQKLFELFIKSSHNEELMMLVAPMKLVNKTLFPSSLDFETLFDKVSSSILCRILPKYARMLKTASRNLMDSIFQISAMILEKVVDENNNPSLNRIYKFAIQTLFECPNSITFITTLNRKQPKVSEIPISEVNEYERTREDVQRALSRLPQFVCPSFNPITDCKSYLNVTTFLDSNSKPTILPFGAQQEMIDGMIRVSQEIQSKKDNSTKKVSKRDLTGGMASKSSMITYVPNMNATIGIDEKPMISPKLLLPKQKISTEIADANIVLSDIDFLHSSNF